ncbi:MAG TPA: hypothetical protein VJ927_10105 [Actinomycetota bacterium]|nr:hypothetical protein [Actinomycetota bacterium]
MDLLLLGGQVIALVVMFAISVWGWRRIPADARVRRSDDSGLDLKLGKTAVLASTPLVGLLVVVATASSDPVNRDSLAVAGLALMGFLLFAHAVSVRRAAS